MQTVAILNQKGGVGKTTTAVHLGSALATLGQRVLLVDLDPQAHLSLHLGLDGDAERPSVYSVLLDATPLEEAIVPASENLSVVSSGIDLAAAEVELVSVVGREVILRDALEAVQDRFDVCLIDCPPSLGILALNALAAASEVLIPLQPHFLALQGFGRLLETVALVNRRINPRLRVRGVVFCMYETGTRLSAEVVSDLRAFLEQTRGSDLPWGQARVFNSVIRRNVRLAESSSYGQTVFRYAPNSRGAADYSALAHEILEAWAISAPGAEANTAAKASPPTSTKASEARPVPISESVPSGSAHPASDKSRLAV